MYAKKYAYEDSITFILVILALLVIGILYVFIARVEYSFAGLILVSLASAAIIYWTIYLKRISKVESTFKYKQDQSQDIRSWVYDLIKSDNEIVFMAEVPGPEDSVNVRLINGILYIKGGQGFAKEVPLDVDESMSITEFRYRNGILTLKIKKL